MIECLSKKMEYKEVQRYRQFRGRWLADYVAWEYVRLCRKKDDKRSSCRRIFFFSVGGDAWSSECVVGGDNGTVAQKVHGYKRLQVHALP